MTRIKDQAAEHNKKVVERRRGLDIQAQQEQKLLHAYAKGLSKNNNVLWTEVKILKRDTAQRLWDMGRRLVVLRARTPHGEFLKCLEENGIAKSTAYRAINAVMNIPDADLKALSRNPSHNYELPGPMTEEQEELAERLESGDFTPHDVARRSPVDVKKYLKKIEKLEKDLETKNEKSRRQEKEITKLKLGTFDEQAIRDRLKEWHRNFELGMHWIFSLKNIPEQSVYDIFAALYWVQHRSCVAEIHLVNFAPALEQYENVINKIQMVKSMVGSDTGKNFDEPKISPKIARMLHEEGLLPEEHMHLLKDGEDEESGSP